MNSDKIYQLLQEIANIGSTKEKTKIVTENIHDLDFQNVLSYALDPTKIYGIVPSLQWQEINSSGTKEFDFTTNELIKSFFINNKNNPKGSAKLSYDIIQ